MENVLDEPRFDYDSFEKDLYEEVCRKIGNQENKDDIYAFSIDYFPEYTTYISLMKNTYSNLKKAPATDRTDLMYYKYCEEEWGNWDNFDMLSEQLVRYYDAMEEWGNSDDDEECLRMEEIYGQHKQKIISLCVGVLQRVKKSPEYASYQKLNLNVHVREGFAPEEEIEIYKKLNNEEAVEEYRVFLYGETDKND